MTIVDSTVQEKAIAYPTDSRPLDIARRKVVMAASEWTLQAANKPAARCKAHLRGSLPSCAA